MDKELRQLNLSNLLCSHYCTAMITIVTLLFIRLVRFANQVSSSVLWIQSDARTECTSMISAETFVDRLALHSSLETYELRVYSVHCFSLVFDQKFSENTSTFRLPYLYSRTSRTSFSIYVRTETLAYALNLILEQRGTYMYCTYEPKLA